jgi:hypothetical protein
MLGSHGHIARAVQAIYTPVLQTTIWCLSLVACVHVGPFKRLFIDGNVVCYAPWQSALMGTVLPALFTYPLLLIFLVRKAQRMDRVGSSMRGVLDNIVRPYRGGPMTQSWEAVIMFQRLVLVLVSVFTAADTVWRPWVLMALLLVAFTLQIIFKPFQRDVPNVLMSLFLSFLLLLAGWEVGNTSVANMGMEHDHGTNRAFGGLVTLFMVLPFTLGGSSQLLPALAPIVKKVSSRLRSHLGTRRNPSGVTLPAGAADAGGGGGGSGDRAIEIEEAIGPGREDEDL